MNVQLRIDPATPHPSSGLFYNIEHARLGNPKAHLFEMWDEDFIGSVVLAERDGGQWFSPAAATFGGYDFGNVASFDFLKAHETVVTELRRRGARSLEIGLPPVAHDDDAISRLVYEMLSAGFEVVRTDLSFLRPVEGDFASRIVKGKAQRLARLHKDGFVTRQADLDALKTVYDVIADNRASRGYPLSMTYEQVEAIARRFPEDVHLFLTTLGDEVAASAFCFRLDGKTMQVVYWGERPIYSKSSPVIGLAESIFATARDLGLKQLDAGTSTIGPDANRGLMTFKTELGFRPSLKFRLRLEISPD